MAKRPLSRSTLGNFAWALATEPAERLLSDAAAECFPSLTVGEYRAEYAALVSRCEAAERRCREHERDSLVLDYIYDAMDDGRGWPERDSVPDENAHFVGGLRLETPAEAWDRDIRENAREDFAAELAEANALIAARAPSPTAEGTPNG